MKQSDIYWSVKILSGAMAGHKYYFNSLENARSECFYLADNGVCASIRAPKYHRDFDSL